MEMENLNSYSTATNKKKRKYKKKSRFSRLPKRTRIIIIAGSIAAGLSILTIIVSVFLSSIKYHHEPINESELNILSTIDEGVINIALFGVDTRKMDDFSGRSDSIMILSVDTHNNRIKVISVMRDSLVPIDGMGYDKITKAYGKGGATLAVRTLNTIFGLDIRDYATVNFFGMEKIIDAVGGLDIEVTAGEIADKVYGLNAAIEEQQWHSGIDPKTDPQTITTPGLQHLNGLQTTAWARLRHMATADGINDDFGRTDRQRTVMNLLFNKALNMSKANYPKLIKAMLPCTQTSLSYGEIIKLAGIFLKDVTFSEMRIAMPEYIINADYRATGESCVYYNYEYAGELMRAFIYDNITPEEYMATNGVDKTPWHNVGSGNSGETSSNTSSSSNSSSNSSTSSGTMVVIDNSSSNTSSHNTSETTQSDGETSSNTSSNSSEESSQTSSAQESESQQTSD